MVNIMMRYLRVLFMGWILVAVSAAASIRVTVSVDPARVPVGGNLRLEYTVNTDNASGIQSPNFSNFELLVGPSVSTFSNYQIVNGRSSSSASTTYTYILSPKKEGTFVIPGAVVTVDGRKYRSQSVRVQVVKGSGRASGGVPAGGGGGGNAAPVKTSGPVSGSDLFITTSTNKTEVYEQEPILLTYKVYTLVNLTQMNAKMPDLKGFLTQEVALPQQKTLSAERYHGRLYQTATWSQYVLFPQQTGKLQIPSIPFEGIVTQFDQSIDPIDAFFNGGSDAYNVKVTRKTQAVNINVIPLPKPQPANFSGGVGSLGISAELLTKMPRTNEAVTLRVVVSGVGNMKLIKTPTVNFPKSFDTYDTKVNDETKLTVEGIKGRMVFDYLVVPKTTGSFTIPAIELVYFDVNSKSYKTVRTQPITMNVAKGKKSNDLDEQLQMRQRDIYDIQKGTDPGYYSGNWWGSWAYVLLNVIILIIFVAVFTLLRRYSKLQLDVVGRRQKRAGKMAYKKLKTAESLMKKNNTAAFYDEVGKALLDYAADRLHMERADLNKENIAEALQQHAVTAEASGAFVTLLQDSEYARYAPAGMAQDVSQFYNRALKAIDEVEHELKTNR